MYPNLIVMACAKRRVFRGRIHFVKNVEHPFSTLTVLFILIYLHYLVTLSFNHSPVLYVADMKGSAKSHIRFPQDRFVQASVSGVL